MKIIENWYLVKFLYKFDHFSRRYGRKQKWVFCWNTL